LNTGLTPVTEQFSITLDVTTFQTKPFILLAVIKWLYEFRSTVQSFFR